jgi:hypothetical protein
VRLAAVQPALVDVADQEVGAAPVAALPDLAQELLPRDARLPGAALAEVVTVGIDQVRPVLRDALQPPRLAGPVVALSLSSSLCKLGQLFPWVCLPYRCRQGPNGDPVAESDGECVQRRFPATCSCSAFSAFPDQAVAVDTPARDISCAEIEQLDRGVVAREVTAGFGKLPQLEVDRFDRVGRVDDLPDGGIEGQERDELVPGPFPGGDQPRVFFPKSRRIFSSAAFAAACVLR